MPDGVKTNSFTPLDRFMAAVDRRNATYLLFCQLPYATVGQKTVPMFGFFEKIDSLRHNNLRLRIKIFICDTLL